MKFIKYAVGLVIALSVIPLVVVTVNNLDAPKLKTIEFEVLDVDDFTITFSENVYNDLHSLAIVDDDIVSNLISVKINDLDRTDIAMTFINDKFTYSDSNGIDWIDISINNTFTSEGYTPIIGDTWTMTFNVSNPLPPLVKLLVGFIPLLLASGILLFMLNKRKLD